MSQHGWADVSEADAQRAPIAGRGRADAAFLAAGSLVGGLLAYVFFVLVIRALGAGPAAPVSVLWSWWGFAGAALTFPVQHWIARTAATGAGEAAVRRGLGHVTLAVLGVSLLAGGLAWLARDRLFGPDADFFPLLVVGVGLGSGLLGVQRGLLSARHRFSAVALGIVTENSLRCVAAIVLVVFGSDTALPYGLALLVGYAVALGWPNALIPQHQGTAAGSGPLRFVSGASGGQLLAQATLTGGPVLLAAIGGAPSEVTVLFAGLALFRAPYTLALGVVSALTGRLTLAVEQGRWARLAQIRRAVTLATLAVGIAAGVGGAWLGPPVMEIVFGDGVRLGSGQAGLVAVGTVLAMANLVVTLGLLARDRAGVTLACWAIGIPVGALAHAVAGGDALTTTCWTFVAMEAVAFLALIVSEARSDRLVSGQEHRGAKR